MKNLVKFLVPAAVAALALVSCNKEDNYTAPEENAVTIRVHASADDLLGEDGTKTYIDNKTILWGTGEYMKLALTAGETTTFATSTDASADIFDGDTEAMFEFSVSPATASEYVYQGIYPASAVVASSNTNAANYKVNLPTIQNATASSYDPAAYIMVAKPESFASVQTDWEASFLRGTALNKITLKNVPTGVSIKRVKITAEGKKLAGGRHFDLTAGEGSDVYGNESTIEVHYATPLSGENVDVWFTSWDAEIAAGETLTIVVYTTDKKSYTKEIVVPSGKTIKFQERYLNTLGATLSGISAQDVTEMEEGDYVVLAKDGEHYYALKAEQESGKERLLSVPYSGSLVSYNGDADIIWNLSKSGDSFIFENSSKYLGYKGSGNESYWLEPDASWTETNYLLDVTAQSTVGLYYVTLHSNSSRYLSKNSSAAFFAFYGNTGQKADIVFVPATVDTRTPVTLSFDEDAINLTTATASSFTGQTVTASPNVTDVTDHLTWSYEDPSGIIESFNNGGLSLNGDEGSATITVSFAGDSGYRAAEASYSITVSAASGPQYELVSAANDVVAGDYIITWDNTYYLPSGSTSGTNPAVGTGITVAGNKITNTVTADMVWTFTGDNTNGFTISDGTNILHSTNAAQGISITTTSTRKWTASVDGTYGMLLRGDDGGTRNLAVYNSGSWRYYSTGSNYSGTLRLYKLADNREDAPISWSAATGTATMSSSGISSSLPSLNNTSSLAVSYASSNEAVATVANDGTVTILGGGSTSISATYDGSAANAPYKTTTVSYTLTVTDNRTACATPTFSPAAGEVESGDEIAISSATTGATIYYTTGNSEFSAGDWTQYTAPVAVTSACTIKAIAVKANYLNSEVASATYTIAASASTIAQVLAGGAGTYTINNILVYSVVGKQVIVGDSSGKMVLYKDGHGLEVGDNISIPAATVAAYNGILQIQDGTFNENSNSNAVDHGTATNLNDATVATSTLSTFSASGYHAAQFVTMNGTQSSRYINGTNANLYLSATNNTYDGQAVTVTGYIYYYNSNYSNYNFQLVSIALDESTPTISVSPSSLSWAADETDSKTLTVTLNGAAAAGDYGYSITSGTAADWNISNNGSGTITVSPKAANTSTTAAKSITLRIYHADDSNVYQDVECSQGKAGNTTTTEEITSGTFSGDANSISLTTSSGITITQLKNGSTNVNTSYNTVSTLRVYRANQMQFTGKTFTKIEMYYTGTYSGADWSVVAGGGTVTIDTTNKKVVWTNTSGASTVTLQNSTSSGTNTQLRTTKFYFEY